MVMYAISVVQLIDAICDCDVREAWFTDDVTAAGSPSGLRRWWSGVVKLGPAYGYHVKPSKSWLIVKLDYFNMAKEVFADCGVGITAEGKRHLSAAIGSQTFAEQYVNDKVDFWVSCVMKLSAIAMSYPHVAYCAFTHGLVGKWTYFLNTLLNISDLLHPLESTILKEFIPANAGKSISDLERELFSLLV